MRWPRRRLKCEVRSYGQQRLRITRRGQRIVGLEVWYRLEDSDAYGYWVWKEPT